MDINRINTIRSYLRSTNLERFTINMPSGRIELGAPALLVIFFIIAAITALVCLITKKNVTRGIFTALMAMYLVVAASLTVFPIYIRCGDIAARFAENGWRITDCIVLIPFHDGISKDDLLNILMTIPFGFLLPFVKKRATWKTALIAGAVLGTTIELIQLVLAAVQGFSFRCVDVADVICNTVGTMIGWLIAAAFICFVQKRKHSGSNGKSLYTYITQRCVK